MLSLLHLFCVLVLKVFLNSKHGRKEVNVELKKEAEFFGDIVFVPYLDNYDLVVMKTLAICEYGDLAYDSLHCCLAVNIFSYLGSMIAFYGPSDKYSCCRDLSFSTIAKED